MGHPVVDRVRRIVNMDDRKYKFDGSGWCVVHYSLGEKKENVFNFQS